MKAALLALLLLLSGACITVAPCNCPCKCGDGLIIPRQDGNPVQQTSTKAPEGKR